jgi:hypothetical protein
MVFGTVQIERIQLNEDSLWYGGPSSRINPDAQAQLETVRGLLFEGRAREAERLAMAALAGVPEEPAHYVPVGDLKIEFEGHDGLLADYRRELDIADSLCRTTYRMDGVSYEREAIASAPDQAIVMRVAADRPGSISCAIRFERKGHCVRSGRADDRTIEISGEGGSEGSVRFSAMARAFAEGGSIRTLGQRILVEGATSLAILVCVVTSYREPDPRSSCLGRLDEASARSWAQLKSRQVAEHHELFDRMDLAFGGDGADGEGPESLATDERLARMAGGGEDPGLAELLFHYARYLLVCSSRPGSLPPNLQGRWNDKFSPPWGSKYTININTEMNYWIAEKANLGPCHEPLFDLVERMLPRGREVARAMYGCRGFVAHHNTDLWGDCAPVDHWVPGTIWPMGAAWFCLHLWEHWEYSGDLDFLKRAYPTIREAALFQLDYLRPSPEGYLVTNPSVSPENSYVLPSGETCAMCYGPAMDSQILRALFGACIEAARVLGLDAELAAQMLKARDGLPPPRIGNDGRLLEWAREYKEAEVGHRHLSHLFGLYPDDQFSLDGTPDLARACRLSLEARLREGEVHTGWSLAWIANLWARLHEGEEAWTSVEDFLRDSTFPNLFGRLSPQEVFQIDGNFGIAASLLEMVLQCVGGTLCILPALPRAMSSGFARGLRAKGGFELSLAWEDGALKRLTIASSLGGACRLRYARPLSVKAIVGASPEVERSEDGSTSFATGPGGRYEVSPL